METKQTKLKRHIPKNEANLYTEHKNVDRINAVYSWMRIIANRYDNHKLIK